MKYLEYTPLDRINDFLSQVNLGERTIRGCLEAYSCKHAGTDKKLSLSLENEILGQLGKSSYSDSSSPVDCLISRSSRKTMIYLLLTLHHMYPDYDFSAMRAHEFFAEENWDSFKQIFDVYMLEASKHVVACPVGKLSECEIYSYNPDAEADPFLEKQSIKLLEMVQVVMKMEKYLTAWTCNPSITVTRS